jgi:hypothetical protein
MGFRLRLVSILAITLLLGACATKPQLPVELASDSLPRPGQERVGVANAKLPKATLHLPGAYCLLCMIAAQAANSSLGKHADTLGTEDVATFKEQIAAALRKKGVDSLVIAEEVEIDKLPDASASDSVPNVARKNFAALKDKYKIDRLVLVHVSELGIERGYSAYIPNGAPHGVVRGTGYMVNLAKNTYDWYLPLSVTKTADGAWDEPAKFPGLTNAYYQAIEGARDQLLQPFKR